jgi:hypothetical protein
MTKRNVASKLPIPKPAPVEFAGQWVAWNKQRTEIVAHGKAMAAVCQAAIAAGHPDSILQRVRDPNARYIGLFGAKFAYDLISTKGKK